MEVTVSVITPTCDRPVGFALAEFYMARQTRQPDEWIVADGGATPVTCTRGQVHSYQPRTPGAVNFAANLSRAVTLSSCDVIAIIEDDDWYASTHLEQLVGRLIASDALIAGDDDQRYYNVAHRCWRRFENKGGCLCQTAFRRELVPLFQSVIVDQLQQRKYGIDTVFWSKVPRDRWSLAQDHTVLGIKGLPGQVGLGIGHRPDHHWTPDRDGSVLRQWIGDDAVIYAGYGEQAA